MILRFAVTLAAASMVFVGGACAPESSEEQEGESGSALRGKTRAVTGEEAAVAIYIQSEAGTSICTGALIAPNVVLTAAHCFVAPGASNEDHTVAANVSVKVGSSPSSWVDSSEVDDVLVHPSYDSSSRYDRRHGDGERGHADIAALVLSRKLDVAPYPIRRAKLDASTNGATVKLVGFGRTDRDDPSTAQTKRSGTATISQRIVTEFFAAPTGASACAGDSGGPTLLRGRDGTWALVGLESHGPGDPNCVKGTYKTRIDAFLPFVDDALARAR